jgi:hypothetical protein
MDTQTTTEEETKDKITISIGNMKLGKIPSFSISTSNCALIPGPAEQGCDKYCYAKKHIEKIYPSARRSYEANSRLTRDPAFAGMLWKALKDCRPLTKTGIFRWHVAGDFYSQEYLNNCIEVMKLFPDVRFYAYTKAYHLDWSARPANFNVILSDDKRIWQNKYGLFDAVATINEPETAPPDGFAQCPGHCDTCGMCYKMKQKVAFHRH